MAAIDPKATSAAPSGYSTVRTVSIILLPGALLLLLIGAGRFGRPRMAWRPGRDGMLGPQGPDILVLSRTEEEVIIAECNITIDNAICPVFD